MQLLFKYDHSDCEDDLHIWIDDLLAHRDDVKSYTVFAGSPADHFIIDYIEQPTASVLDVSWIDFMKRVERTTHAEFIGRE